MEQVEQPRCSRCGAIKALNELSGYDPLAPAGKKFLKSYCLNAIDCDSEEAREILDGVLRALNESTADDDEGEK